VYNNADSVTHIQRYSRIASCTFELRTLTQVADLPTHPLFSGDNRILQGSPAHPRRIASHPHLAIPLNQSAIDHEDEVIPYSGNFRGRKLAQINEKYNFRGEHFRE